MKEAWDEVLFWKRKRAVVISTPTGLAVILVSAHVISGEGNGAGHQKGWHGWASLGASVASVSSSKAPSIFDQRQARIVSRTAGRSSINQTPQRALTCFGPRFLTTGYPSLQYRRECVATALLFRDRSAMVETRSARLLGVAALRDLALIERRYFSGCPRPPSSFVDFGIEKDISREEGQPAAEHVSSTLTHAYEMMVMPARRPKARISSNRSASAPTSMLS